MCRIYVKGTGADSWCFCKERPPPSTEERAKPHWNGSDRSWAELRYLVEKKAGLHSGRRDVSTTVYVGHLEGEDERNGIALADEYVVGANDTIAVKRLPVNYKCRTWLPFSQAAAERTYECDKRWDHWSRRIAEDRARGVPEHKLLKMCKQQQDEGLVGYMDERWLKKRHPSRQYIEDHYKGWRHSPTEIEPILRPPCSMCWDITGEPGHLPVKCPAAAAAGSRWPGLSGLCRPTGIPWIKLQQVPRPATLEEVVAAQWYDPASDQFWCTREHGGGTGRGKKSGKKSR